MQTIRGEKLGLRVVPIQHLTVHINENTVGTGAEFAGNGLIDLANLLAEMPASGTRFSGNKGEGKRLACLLLLEVLYFGLVPVHRR